ncbi:hypothetical protein F5883DRAFT_183737 [Diaporthe sp. PMI_573]|nr:hypothetical protein F5883DRAFT_183737 [Diaporthaceae sp. PMI_573]
MACHLPHQRRFLLLSYQVLAAACPAAALLLTVLQWIRALAFGMRQHARLHILKVLKQVRVMRLREEHTEKVQPSHFAHLTS